MKWIDGISEAIDYIEDNITEELLITDISKRALMSAYYFQRGFSILCGFTVGEYIRKRRLSLAGSELLSTDKRIIDIALKYGYDSPDSFTKAFTRFHGVTPTAVRKDGLIIKSFARLKIIIALEGGCLMDYKIVEKDSFTVIGTSEIFRSDSAFKKIPEYWSEYYKSGQNKIVCGKYGVCIDESTDSDEFEYLIADDYFPGMEVPSGFVTKVIPRHTWAVFPCKGPMPNAIQDVNQKIYSEWLPNNKDYEIAGDYNIELYTSTANYPNGNNDENYYSEIWIPVKKSDI